MLCVVQQMLFAIIWRHVSNWDNVVARMYIIACILDSISRYLRVIMRQLLQSSINRQLANGQ